eukprot:359159-Chlamydomonas_euryale.AAC.15
MYGPTIRAVTLTGGGIFTCSSTKAAALDGHAASVSRPALVSRHSQPHPLTAPLLTGPHTGLQAPPLPQCPPFLQGFECNSSLSTCAAALARAGSVCILQDHSGSTRGELKPNRVSGEQSQQAWKSVRQPAQVPLLVAGKA